MGVQRAINGQLITWEVIVYGFLGMEQVAATYNPQRPRHRLDAAANCTRPTLKSCLHSINYRVSWKENRTRRQDNGTAI